MSFNDSDSNPVTVPADLVLAAAALQQGAENLPFALVPSGYKIVCTERLQEAPLRPRHNVTLRTVASFLDFTKRYVADDAGLPAYYTNNQGNGLNVRVVFNGLTWADSTAELTLLASTPLRRWMSFAGAGPHRQRAFAQFIEDNLADVVEPQGAKLLEICRGFRATQTVRFASTVDLANGDVGLEYITETKAGTVDAKSRLQVPEFITLGLALFAGEERMKIKARFTYTIEDGILKMGIKFPQLEAAYEAATADIMARLHKALPKFTFMDGVCPAVPPIEFNQSR